MEERLMHKWCFVCISINKYSCSCVYKEPYMANEDKFYVVLLGGDEVCTQLGLKAKLKLLVTRVTFRNHKKKKKTRHEVVSAWVMYEPRWKKP